MSNYPTEAADIDDFAEEARVAPTRGTIKLLPDPGLIWQIFRRNLTLFLLAALVVSAAVAVWTLTRTPVFSATASILLEPEEGDVVAVKSVGPQLSTDSDAVDTEVRLIQSEILAQRVARAYADKYVRPGGGSWNDEAITELAADMRGSLSVARDGLTYVIDVTSTGDDAEKAAVTANLFVENYVQSQQDAKVGATKSANEWLNTRLLELESNATAAQAALQNYKVNNGLMSANGATMAEQEVSTLNQEIATARAELAEKRGRLNAAESQLREGGQGADVGAALGSSTISGLRAQEAAASAKLAQMNARYGPRHPERAQAANEMADIREKIQLEINRILSAQRAEVEVAQSRLASLTGSRNSATGSLASNNRANVGLAELEQRAKAAQAIYETFLNRSRETAAQVGLQQSDSKIASRAEVPDSPSFPNYKLMGIAAVLAGLFCGLLAIGIAEYLKRGIQTKRDVERKLKVRYAGAIPTLKSALGKIRVTEPAHEYIVSHPHSLFAESFRSIRAFLTLSASTRPRAIAITSALPQEGKTTTSLCLARATAMEGLRTILVDTDLRRRGSSELVNFTNGHDLYDYLDRKASLASTVTVDPSTNLHILGTNAVQTGARNPLTGENITRMLDELRANYDVIIIDTPPILGVADAREIAALADRVLLLTRWKKTSSRAVEAAIDMLLDSGAKLTGVALTQVDIAQYASTGDGDIYGYQKKFKGYYVN